MGEKPPRGFRAAGWCGLDTGLCQGTHEHPGVPVTFAVDGRDMGPKIHRYTADGNLVSESMLPYAVEDGGTGILGHDANLSVVCIGFDFVVHPRSPCLPDQHWPRF